MTTHNQNETLRLARRAFLAGLLVAMSGCTSTLIRGKNPEIENLVEEVDNETKLVGDYAGAWGFNYKKLESVGLLTGLDNTGSDPPASIHRTFLLNEMKSRDVKNPNAVLASPKTSLVLITAHLPPAVQKGDQIDVTIRVPPKSTSTSLRGGWLMESRLREMLAVNGRIRQGHEAALAQGAVVVDGVFQGDGDKLSEVSGIVLGGGVATQERKLGLMIRRDDVSIETTSVIGAAINERFNTFERGSKKGAAEPKNANFVQLAVPPRYRQNLGRYVLVVRSIAMGEKPVQRARRLETLEKRLLEPSTAVKASLQLEAIGREAIPILKKGLASRDAEVRFHAAEALAYLEEADCAKVLAESAEQESAFRWSALTALSSMDHVQAFEALSGLLHSKSAETRYGAFRALRSRNPHDPMLKGELLGGEFHLHVVSTTGEPMVHVTKTTRPEIVLFGQQEIWLKPPQGIFAGKEIVINSSDFEQIKVSRFSPGKEDRVEYCSNSLADLLRTIVKLGGTYGDAVQAIHEAKKSNLFDAKLAVEALPTQGRTYLRPEEDEGDGDEESLDNLVDTVSHEEEAGGDENKSSAAKGSVGDLEKAGDFEPSESYVDPKFSPATKKSVWSKMTGWMSGGE